MPHIVHMSSAHPARDTRILYRECRSLVEAGHEVTLIANAECDFNEYGVRIRALPQHTGSRFSRMTLQVWNTYQMARQEDADLYHFHDPELIPAGVCLQLLGKPVIYDVHESVYEQILSKHWIAPRLRRVIAGAYRLLESSAARIFSAIVAATPYIAESFPSEKVTTVQNFPILSELDLGESSEIHTNRTVYVGSVTRERGLAEMMLAMELLPPSDVELVIAGDFAPAQLREEAEYYPGRGRTHFAGRLDRSQVAGLLASASVGLVTLWPVPNHLESYPVKLFEYMAAGLPVVASDFPYWRQFVEETGAGVMVDPMDPQAIADGILVIVENPDRAQAMGEAGKRAIRERFNWDTEAVKLIDVVSRLIGSANTSD